MIAFISAVRNIIRSAVAIVLIIPLLLTAWIPGDPDTPVMVNANATNPYINEYLDTDVSAHRSGAGIVPQNTLMAFEYVLKNNKKLLKNIKFLLFSFHKLKVPYRMQIHGIKYLLFLQTRSARLHEQ